VQYGYKLLKVKRICHRRQLEWESLFCQLAQFTFIQGKPRSALGQSSLFELR
jgi:hypothetical protein